MSEPTPPQASASPAGCSPPAAAPSSADALTPSTPCDGDSGTAHAEGATAGGETVDLGAGEPHLLAAIMATYPCERWPESRVREFLIAAGDPRSWAAAIEAARASGVLAEDAAIVVVNHAEFRHPRLCTWGGGGCDCPSCAKDYGADLALARLLDAAEARP